MRVKFLRSFLRGSGSFLLVVAGLLTAQPANALFHTWVIAEIYSNADGSVQFVEFEEHQGLNGQNLLTFSGSFTSDTNVLVFPSDLPSTATANKRFLIGTTSYAAAIGAVAPDYTVPDNFFSLDGDTLSFFPSPDGPIDEVTFGCVHLPTDGVSSLPVSRVGAGDTPVLEPPAANSPTNFAGETGSLNLAGPERPCAATSLLEAEVTLEEKLKLKNLLKDISESTLQLELAEDGTWSLGSLLEGIYAEKGDTGRKYRLEVSKESRSALLDALDAVATAQNGSEVDVRKRSKALLFVKINEAGTKVKVSGEMKVKGGEPEGETHKGKWAIEGSGPLAGP